MIIIMERRSKGKIWSRNTMRDDTGIIKAGMAIVISLMKMNGKKNLGRK